MADYQAGVRVKELATKYGISRETVSRHLRRHAIAPCKVGWALLLIRFGHGWLRWE